MPWVGTLYELLSSDLLDGDNSYGVDVIKLPHIICNLVLKAQQKYKLIHKSPGFTLINKLISNSCPKIIAFEKSIRGNVIWWKSCKVLHCELEKQWDWVGKFTRVSTDAFFHSCTDLSSFHVSAYATGTWTPQASSAVDWNRLTAVYWCSKQITYTMACSDTICFCLSPQLASWPEEPTTYGVLWHNRASDFGRHIFGWEEPKNILFRATFIMVLLIKKAIQIKMRAVTRSVSRQTWLVYSCWNN